MSVYYEVYVTFKFVRGKSTLSKLSLHTSSRYLDGLIPSTTSFQSHSFFFYTLRAANQYIDHLFKKFPNCGLPRPTLDSQPSLF